VVPPWFAVTDAAFQAVLDVPVAAGQTGPPAALRAAIDRVLADGSLTPASASDAIRDHFIHAVIPDDLSRAISGAYRELGPECEVAVRSSAFDEDTARATRAGLFETCLGVRGDAAVLRHVLQVWAGMWSERALADRAGRHDLRCPGGGVLVQRMVRARISGVVQTINVAESQPCEMVINVGLGLGEGIVRGTVAADHVVVAKDSLGATALRFRYLTADKRTRVIVDDRFGAGTTTVETLAHQRLRPALEYPELVALAGAAERLELAWAQPVDIEFAFEDADLRILQVRPVPAAHAVWRDTIERFPFDAVGRRLEERS
jgi:pyruvate,water dikinase